MKFATCSKTTVFGHIQRNCTYPQFRCYSDPDPAFSHPAPAALLDLDRTEHGGILPQIETS